MRAVCVSAANVVAWVPSRLRVTGDRKGGVSVTSERWQRRFSVALQKGNARVIISRARMARDQMGVRVGRSWGRARQSSELDDGSGYGDGAGW